MSGVWRAAARRERVPTAPEHDADRHEARQLDAASERAHQTRCRRRGAAGCDGRTRSKLADSLTPIAPAAATATIARSKAVRSARSGMRARAT